MYLGGIAGIDFLSCAISWESSKNFDPLALAFYEPGGYNFHKKS